MFRSSVVKTGRVLDGVAIELEGLLNHDRGVGWEKGGRLRVRIVVCSSLTRLASAHFLHSIAKAVSGKYESRKLGIQLQRLAAEALRRFLGPGFIRQKLHQVDL
jgi:hypothetical protein